MKPLLLGLGAVALLFAASKSSHAASGGTSKGTRAEWLAAIAHAKGQSYEQYVKVLNSAYKTGLFTQDEIAKLQKQHRDFPKAGAGSHSTAGASSATPTAAGKSVEQQIAEALATNNPTVLLALAEKLKAQYPQAAADLQAAAAAILKASNQATASSPGVVPPPVAPAPTQTSSKPKPKPRPQTSSTPRPPMPVEAGMGPAADPRKQLALEVVKDLSLNPPPYKGNPELLKALAAQEGNTNPNGVYGMGSGLSLIKYDLVPPKPRVWGKDAKATAEMKKRWRGEMLTMARKDPARAAEWQGAALV